MKNLKLFAHLIKILIYKIFVILRIPNPKAFILVLDILVKKKLTPYINSLNYDPIIMNKIYDEIILIYSRAKKLNSINPFLYLWVSIASLHAGKIENWKNHRINYVNSQKNVYLKAKKKGLDFEVIEPGLITRTIGTSFNLDALIKSRMLGLQENKRLILPLIPQIKDRIINPCLLNYFRPYIDIIEDPKEAKYYRSLLKDLMCVYDIYIPCGKNIVPLAHTCATYIQSIWDQQKRKPLFQLTDEHRHKGNSILKKIGLPDDAWFVTCHVREPQFKGKESFRDSDIQTFFKAFEEITKRGGWVIRMGDKRMTSLPKMPQVFDYALSEHKSDWMDVFLLGGAKFMLGTSSGPTAVSHIFGVPIAMTNNTPTVETYLGNKDLFLPRLMKRIDDGRMLNLVELMTSPYNSGIIDGLYKNIYKVKTIPNTDLEIKNLCIEMMDRLEGTIKYSQEEEKLQEIFKKKTAEKEVMIGIPNFPIQCRLGKYFLNQHKNLLVNI